MRAPRPRPRPWLALAVLGLGSPCPSSAPAPPAPPPRLAAGSGASHLGGSAPEGSEAALAWLERLAALPAGPAAVPDPADAQRCATRRRRIAAEIGDGVLLLEAGAEGEGRFLADPDFYWLVGLAVPDALLVLEVEGGRLARERLYLPAHDPLHELWNGPRPSPGPKAARATGIADTRPLQALESDLAALSGVRRWLGRGERVGALLAASGRQAESDTPAFRSSQAVKDEAELAALRAAVDVTQAALAEAFRAAVPGAWEFTAEAALEAGFRRRGAQGPAFATIAGSGRNACYLHYRDNSRRLQDGDLLLLDVGARLHYYCADVTRTIPVSGRFDARQREVYTLVYEASRKAAAALRPGVSLREVHRVAQQFLEKHGFERQHFPHSIGHGLGLRVHDFPWKEDPLEPGMVVTIEPGLYLADEGLGVRIEDVYVITADGAELLSDDLPADPDALEALLAALRRDP